MAITGTNQTKCIYPEIGRYRKQYQLKLFEENNPSDIKRKLEFESHLKDCQYCTDRINWWSMLMETTRTNPHLLSDANRVVEKPGWITGLFRRQVFAALSAMLALLVIGAGSVYYVEKRDKVQLGQLAWIKEAPYKSSPLRGDSTLATQLFNEAMEDYDKKDFAAAEEKLTRVIREDENRTIAYYYQGISRAKIGKYKQAIEALQSCIDRAKGYPRLEEDARWYLANAALKAEDPNRALIALEKIAADTGVHKEDARRLIPKIKDIQDYHRRIRLIFLAVILIGSVSGIAAYRYFLQKGF